MQNFAEYLDKIFSSFLLSKIQYTIDTLFPISLFPFFRSSYCGSLWLGALRCFTKIARILDHKKTAIEYEAVLAKASKAFQEKLWNGKSD